MTARQLFEYALIEINKVEAPSLLLDDYNYLLNKAVINYVNKRYNIYDTNQQTTDDLRVLTGTAVITGFTLKTGSTLFGATYIGRLPSDYFHLLGCIAEFNVTKKYKCYNPSTPFQTGVKRLTADKYPALIDNYYLKPSFKNPYYYIHNDVSPTIDVNQVGVNDEQPSDTVRHGNSSPVNIEIRYGKDNTLFVLSKVFIDYLRVPRYIKLTQAQVDTTEDLSSIVEFPDYVCYEIIKELVILLMENASDPRLQSNIPINQSIAPPQGGQSNRRA